MYFSIIDCGTTNSRVYILNDKYDVICKGIRQIGVKDTAVNGSNNILKEGLKELFEETISNAGLNQDSIEFAITSGMITSEIGLMEIPHIWAPAGIDELSDSITPIRDKKIFPVDVSLLFIRGIKNIYPQNADYHDIRMVDFMRGEETQMAGLISLYPKLQYPLTAVVLSSHTKYISVNDKKKIIGSLTTISGQIFDAIKERTFLGKSITDPDGKGDCDFFESMVIDAAYESVRHAGFLRTLMMPRFMEVLLKQPWYIRKHFLDATIVAEDLNVLRDFDIVKFPKQTAYVLIGHKRRCNIFKYLLEKHYGVTDIQEIYEDKVDSLSIGGAIAIAEKAGYLRGARS